MEQKRHPEGRLILMFIKNRIAFLVGSGISIKANMPSTKDITDELKLADDNNLILYINRMTGENLMRDFIKHLINFLRCYITNRNINYEDIYFFSSQIEDHLSGQYDNPIIQYFIDSKKEDIIRFCPQEYQRDNVYELISQMTLDLNIYISKLLSRILGQIPNDIDYLNIFNEINDNKDIDKLDIFSLNHDVILERYFTKKEIEFSTGFYIKDDVKYKQWDPDLFESDEVKIKLYKLHSSISWYDYKLGDENDTEITFEVPLDKTDRDVINDIDSKYYNARGSGSASTLIGTYNKLYEYSHGIFHNLFCLFTKNMRMVDSLIVCGYSFRDKGINNLIIEWLNQSIDKKIILIHENPNSLLKDCFPAIRSRFISLEKQERIKFILKHIGEDENPLIWNDIIT